ncbi:STE protein kinase [Magnaporthiopsis poae ATCC 64411]|uniref:STE protein kinase n=1 Tax=Magnaporthiopsis poae (strain ATCC 64411 / 73-15) TaxID=644358 RepID=A0A0C4EBS1_MAGP6|nr:STE protein kinase [Magnaporthiopsis poae ATCC 64411]
MDNLCTFELEVLETKTTDGRYGPVLSAMRPDTGELLTAYRLDLDESAKKDILKNLTRPPPQQHGQPPSSVLLSYLGYQCKGGQTYLLTKYIPGVILHDFIHKRPVSPPLVRVILRQLVRALQQLYDDQGFAVVFIDSKHILLDNVCNVKVEAPLCDVTRTGEALPSAILTLPELVLGGQQQQGMRKADVWLLGIIAIRMLAGKRNLVDANTASQLGEQIKKGKWESAFELLVPDKVKALDDGPALGFLRQCFTIDVNQRPSISDLQNHSFLTAT